MLARQYYDEGRQRVPVAYQNNYDLDAWLRFLAGAGLIEQGDDSVGITDSGRELLRYMAETRAVESFVS